MPGWLQGKFYFPWIYHTGILTKPYQLTSVSDKILKFDSKQKSLSISGCHINMFKMKTAPFPNICGYNFDSKFQSIVFGKKRNIALLKLFIPVGNEHSSRHRRSSIHAHSAGCWKISSWQLNGVVSTGKLVQFFIIHSWHKFFLFSNLPRINKYYNFDEEPAMSIK